jgi:La-related protein 7
MDGQAPPLLDAVVPEPLAVGDELHPPRPAEMEDALPSGMDGQAPPLDGVARDPLTVSDELQPTGEVVEEDALPVAPDIVKGEVVEEDALPVAPDIVKGEVVVEDALPIAPDIVNDASSEGPETCSGSVVLTDELRDRIVKQVRSLWTFPLQLLFPYALFLLNTLIPKFLCDRKVLI